ncbi:hypothetical protein NUW58_g9432 [Xylaria curta]|uniref:Uncharacterized protein n=1 Tax=Xylaria curta TaxID=42375 RepID=A0ACC1MX28_9PEZI|nr:hypothetical protein NUW58_g9432 [Xylaria curta]
MRCARRCQLGVAGDGGTSVVRIVTSANGFHTETSTGALPVSESVEGRCSIPAYSDSRRVFQYSPPSSERPSCEASAYCSSVRRPGGTEYAYALLYAKAPYLACVPFIG